MQWHLYCRVVDNFGDIGVGWRLAADLAARGERVRLFVDDASALAWLAPRGAEGVELRAWSDAAAAPADVIAELFGGGLPDQARGDDDSAGDRPPLRVNVEHLSAEAYVARSHGLPSPRRSRDGTSVTTTWFFYPGFDEGTGGLIRERGVPLPYGDYAGDLAWLASLGAAARPGERRAFVFCYENLALDALLDALAVAPTLLLVAPGAASQQVAAALGPTRKRGRLRAVDVPFLPQPDFDRLLAMCELNLVRGEDSLVRAIWAGSPFLWQLYPQDDGAHVAKLDAFLERFLAGASLPLQRSLRGLFERWNGIGHGDDATAALGSTALAAWRLHCIAWRDGLAAQDDLVTRLIAFVKSRR